MHNEGYNEWKGWRAPNAHWSYHACRKESLANSVLNRLQEPAAARCLRADLDVTCISFRCSFCPFVAGQSICCLSQTHQLLCWYEGSRPSAATENPLWVPGAERMSTAHVKASRVRLGSKCSRVNLLPTILQPFLLSPSCPLHCGHLLL